MIIYVVLLKRFHEGEFSSTLCTLKSWTAPNLLLIFLILTMTAGCHYFLVGIV